MKLVWDSQKFKIQIDSIDVYIAPEDCPPFPVKAIVEEQDTSLVLEPADEIHEYSDDKPIWYLSNTQELQKEYIPGEVIVKSYNPIRLLAIIHDLNCEPTWSIDWVKKTIENIFSLCREKELKSLGLPILGTQFGKLENEEFLKLLVSQLQIDLFAYPQQIWLVVPTNECQKVYDNLNLMVTNRQCK